MQHSHTSVRRCCACKWLSEANLSHRIRTMKKTKHKKQLCYNKDALRTEMNEWKPQRRNERIVVWFIQCGHGTVRFLCDQQTSNRMERDDQNNICFASRYASCGLATHDDGPNKFTEKSNEQYLNPLRLSSSNLHFALVSFMFMCTTFNWEHSTGSHAHEQKGQNNLQSKLLVIKLAEMIIVMVILWHTNCSISLLHNNNDLRSIIIM